MKRKLNMILKILILMQITYHSTQLKMKDSNFQSLLQKYGSIKISYQGDFHQSINLFAYYDEIKNQIDLKPVENFLNFNKKIAHGEYNRSRYQTGWDTFKGETFDNVNPVLQCYGLGIVEGILSYKEIKNYINNFDFFFSSKEEKENLKSFFEKVDKTITKIINGEEGYEYYSVKEKAYLSCLHAQFTGVYSGYNYMAEEKDIISLYDLYILNSEGYYDYILSYLKINEMNINSKEEFFKKENLEAFYNTSEIEKIWKQLITKSHCSALVKFLKLKNGTNDLYLGHTTWTGYNELLRTMKIYKYGFEGKTKKIGMNPVTIKFSSYPGVIFSGDEFYVIGDNLAIAQTSLSVINGFQYKDCINIKEYIPEFIRVMMVNLMSSSGVEWKDNYVSINKNKHLYASSWIVIDYNNLENDKNLMWIVEDIPKDVKTKDYTFFLKMKGYYSSFNLPYFKKDHGEPTGLFESLNIDFYGDKNLNPRQYITDKLIYDVDNINEFKDLLLYNKYKIKNEKLSNDPSYKNPYDGIASRGETSGAIDFKIVDKNLISHGKIWIYAGPIYGNNTSFEPFNTLNAPNALIPYLKGIPLVFNFKPFYFD